MEDVVPFNNSRVCVRQKRKRVAPLPAVRRADITRIDTDRSEMNASFLEIRKPFLKTPQLGVTQWSPMPAVENQDRAVR